MAAASRPVLLPLALCAACFSVLLLSTPRAFVSAPARGTPAAAASVGALAGLAAGPLAVFAELPPLEELPLDNVAPTLEQSVAGDATVWGVSFPMVLVGLLGAVSWAVFWVTNLMPAKDADGSYKTYIGAGQLPPEGFTNPLDPRVDPQYAGEDDPLYKEEKKGPKGQKSASSAIV